MIFRTHAIGSDYERKTLSSGCFSCQKLWHRRYFMIWSIPYESYDMVDIIFKPKNNPKQLLVNAFHLFIGITHWFLQVFDSLSNNRQLYRDWRQFRPEFSGLSFSKYRKRLWYAHFMVLAPYLITPDSSLIFDCVP